METKKWYTSKTFWFNGLTILVVVATFFGYTPDQEIAETTSVFLLTFAPVINIILRGVTTKPIDGLV